MSVAGNVLRNSASIAKGELLHFFGLFWRALWKTTAILGGLLLLYLLIGWIFDGGKYGHESPVVMVVLMIVYSLMIGVQTGLVVAAVRVTWAMAGPFILVPLILIPLAVVGAFWLFWGPLGSAAESVLSALVASGADHDWLVGKIGPAARIGPPILIIALPLFAMDMVGVLIDGGVIWSLFLFLLLASGVFLFGFLPSALVSMVAVVGAYLRRFARRHREKLANLTSA